MTACPMPFCPTINTSSLLIEAQIGYTLGPASANGKKIFLRTDRKLTREN